MDSFESSLSLDFNKALRLFANIFRENFRIVFHYVIFPNILSNLMQKKGVNNSLARINILRRLNVDL